MKIAMWSGPRNLSTAMMYSFGNRNGTTVYDEPFYAAYLARSGVEHPMREEVLEHGEIDAEKVSLTLGKTKGPVFLKLMTFHMLDGFPFAWADDYVHVHLIRHPARVIASYTAKREHPNLRDVGFSQQVEIFDRYPGPVINAFDIRKNPEKKLRKLCEAIDIPFEQSMLEWPAGPKPFDGIWASHWYDSVHRSSGFAGPEGALPSLDRPGMDLLAQALPYYEKLEKLAI